jgi:hypothetical protein
MNELEQRLERTLTARADTVVVSDRLSGDAILVAGRAARRRRRHGAIVAVAAGALAVVVGLSLLPLSRPAGTVPVPPGSAPASPTQALPPPLSAEPEPVLSPPGAVPVAALGLDVVAGAGNLIVPAEGAEFTVPLPAGHGIRGAVRVPGGWVLDSYLDSQGPDGGFWMWFVPTGQRPTSLGRLYGNYRVSRDGRRLVVAGSDEAFAVSAYELPSLRKVAEVRIEGPGPFVSGVAGDWAVLRDASGDPGATRAYTWNLRTRQLRGTDAKVNILGVTDDGRVLRRVYQGQRRGCVDLVAVADLPTVELTGLCSAAMGALIRWAELSPDGTWVLMATDASERPVWVRTADLRAGRWRPVASELPTGSSALFWDTAGTVLVRVDEYEFYRCRPTRACERLAVPLLAEGISIAERRG